MIRKKHYTIIIVILIAILNTAYGCFADSEHVPLEGYKVFSKLDGDINFSFEYPENYQVCVNETFKESGSTYIAFTTNTTYSYVFAFFISFEKKGFMGKYNAVEFLEDHIESNLESDNTYIILERKVIDIAGTKAEQVTASYNLTIDEYYRPDGLFGKVKVFSTEIYFDYDNYIGQIYLRSHESTSENDFKIFDHIIETFKIID